jgi:hypothetical protein
MNGINCLVRGFSASGGQKVLATRKNMLGHEAGGSLCEAYADIMPCCSELSSGMNCHVK